MLSDRCLSVCPVRLSATFVHCGQTVGRIKMKLGMQVGPGHIALDGDPAPLTQRSTAPQISAHICCGQTAAWIKMSLGMKLGLGPVDFVLDGEPAPPPKVGGRPLIFGPCLLWPNGWMDEGGTWYGGRPQCRRLCVRWRPSPPPSQKGGGAPHQFSAHVYCGKTAGWIKIALGTEVGLGLRDIVFDVDPATPRKKGTPTVTQFLAHVYCGQMARWMKTPLGTEVDLGPGHTVLDGVPAPAKGAQQPPLFGPCLSWPRSPISATAELLHNYMFAVLLPVLSRLSCHSVQQMF